MSDKSNALEMKNWLSGIIEQSERKTVILDGRTMLDEDPSPNCGTQPAQAQGAPRSKARAKMMIYHETNAAQQRQEARAKGKANDTRIRNKWMVMWLMNLKK